MQAQGRNHCLDRLKLLAALFVVLIHQGPLAGISDEAGAIVRLSGRWAVPFFFLVSGFYLARGGTLQKERVLDSLARTVWLLAFASLIFIPFVLYREGFAGGINRILGPLFFLHGAYFHLWFLGSLALGLTILFACDRLALNALLPVASVAVLLGALALGSYSPLYVAGGIGDLHFAVARQFLSIPFLYIGSLVARHPAQLRLGRATCLALFGYALQLVEAEWLSRYGADRFEHQLLAGSIPFALGLFGIGLAGAKAGESIFSRWGSRHALGIYVLHPLWIPFCSGVAGRNLPMPGLIAALLVFAATLISLILLQHVFPSLKALLDGRPDDIRRIWVRKGSSPTT